MGAKNQVIAGDYIGKAVTVMGGAPQIVLSRDWTENRQLDRVDVERYEVVTEEQSKSAASGVARGLVGGALLGPVGMLAGGLSAKNKGVYTLAVQFKDGKRSLIEVDEKVYKAIVKSCF